jgi:hypothetical protein
MKGIRKPGSNKIEDIRMNYSLQTREEYESTSLLKIKEYSQLDTDEALFDTIVVIENYPLDVSFRQVCIGL